MSTKPQGDLWVVFDLIGVLAEPSWRDTATIDLELWHQLKRGQLPEDRFWDAAQQHRPIGLLVPILALAVPLYDSISVIFLRLRQGVSPMRGDQRHFSHRLVQRGLRPRNAVLTIYLATLATGLSATLLPDASWPTACLILAQCACVVGIIAILEQAKRSLDN